MRLKTKRSNLEGAMKLLRCFLASWVLPLAGVLAVGFTSTAQAQIYQPPAAFVSGTAGQNGASTFRYNNGTDITVTFSTTATTSGGIYSYGVRTANSTLGALGSSTATDYTDATLSSPAAFVDLWAAGCPDPGVTVSGTICNNRGTMTVTFSQPVTDPILHFAGLGATGQGANRFHAIYVLTSAFNGATSVTPSLTRVSGNSAFAVTAPPVTITNNVAAATMSFECNLNLAACGSARFTGTVTQLVFNIGLRGWGSGAYPSIQTTPAADANILSASIAPVADLAITKTNNQTGYLLGQAVTYEIVVTNNGPNSVMGATVTDNFPAALTNTTWTAAYSVGSSGPASGSGNINTAAVNLLSGGIATFTVTATVSATATGNLVNTATVNAPGSIRDPISTNNTATDVDQPAARATISKVSVGGIGAFAFAGTNGIEAQTLITTVAGTPVSGTPQRLTTVGAVTTITEGAPSAGYVLSGIVCTGLPGGTATPNLVTRTVTLNAAATAAGANITCIFTNTLAPVLRLQKALPNGRLAAADQFALTIAGPGGPATVTTTGGGGTATGVATLNLATAGSAYSLSEVAAGGTNLANYTSTYSCANALAGGQAPSGSGASFAVMPVVGDDLTCTFSNAAAPSADLAVVKTSSAPSVSSGGTLSYTLTVTNNGPSAANGAVVRDMPGAGLDCTTPGPTATCSATGGAACGGATVPVASLLGATGVTIPTLPVGGQVVLILQCRVIASGLP